MAGETPPSDDACLLPDQVSVFDPSIDLADDDVGRRLALLIGGYLPAQVVSTLARLGVADELGAGGRDAADLGQALEVAAGPLGRLLRAAATFGVVQLNLDGTFAATPLSDRLRTGTPGS